MRFLEGREDSRREALGHGEIKGKKKESKGTRDFWKRTLLFLVNKNTPVN